MYRYQMIAFLTLKLWYFKARRDWARFLLGRCIRRTEKLENSQ
jgi:hypothetical protein